MACVKCLECPKAAKRPTAANAAMKCSKAEKPIKAERVAMKCSKDDVLEGHGGDEGREVR